jgi:hypothetical protein
MPALKKTDFVGRVVWLGLVADRHTALASQPLDAIEALFSGPVGEAHAGLTRLSCSRVVQQYPRGTTIRNTRQLAVLGADELAAIAAAMGISALDPALLGTTMVIAGLLDVSHLPPCSRLQSPSGLIWRTGPAPCLRS